MAGPRVLISTDIGGQDNDDAQSLIHALFYANDLNYVGFVNTRTDDGGIVAGKPRDGMAMIDEIIDAYGRDLSNLRAADRDYPTAEALRSVVKMGSIDGRFPGQLSDGARHIVSEARKASPGDPLYVLTWGPVHDTVAALMSAPDIVPNVRFISISGLNQDKRNTSALDALKRAIADDPAYKNLWWINTEDAHQGFYLREGGSQFSGIKDTLPWVIDNAKGSGALGDLLHSKYTYDVHTWMPPSTSPDGLKMGDSSSLLYLIDAVNNDNPAALSWGGTFVRTGLGPNTWGDTPAPEHRLAGVDGAGSVARHRAAFLEDYAARLAWAKGEGGGGGGVEVTPDGNGMVRFGGGKIKEPTVTEVRSLDLDDGDRIVFANYDAGTFKSVAGGNPLVVNNLGSYAHINDLADIEELDGASSRVSVLVDMAKDELILFVDKSTGVHEVVLHGNGRAYAETYDAPLL